METQTLEKYFFIDLVNFKPQMFNEIVIKQFSSVAWISWQVIENKSLFAEKQWSVRDERSKKVSKNNVQIVRAFVLLSIAANFNLHVWP